MARYTVYPSRFGYRFDYQVATVRGKGWRPTRAGAKRAALKRTEAGLANGERDVANDRQAPARPAPRPTGDQPTPSTIWRDHGRSPMWGITAAALAFVVIGAAAVFVVQRRTSARTPTGSSTEITILTTTRLQPTVAAIIEAYRVEQPTVTIRIDAVAPGQLAKRASETTPDLAIGEAEIVDRLQPRELTTEVPGAFGFDVLEIRVPAGNPKELTGLADLTSTGVTRVGMCASTEPCGVAAGRSLEKASVPLSGFTRFPGSAAILDALDTGALDAGLVLRADSQRTSTQTEAVPLPGELEERIAYDIVTVRKGPLSRRFTEFLNNSTVTTKILRDHGLLDPTAPPPT